MEILSDLMFSIHFEIYSKNISISNTTSNTFTLNGTYN